ncbi:MAG: hypothetical protein K0Q46_4233 [Rhodococcus erythropolis]|nr:hypothetical protein [Rhodococcus erythropolis]
MVRDTGIEPVTSSVSGKRSPAELIARVLEKNGADDGIRTRDPNLGKVVRYQLRHVRMSNELRYRKLSTFLTYQTCKQALTIRPEGLTWCAILGLNQ